MSGANNDLSRSFAATANAIDKVSKDLSRLSSQIKNNPGGGSGASASLTAASSVGATTVSVDSFPSWAEAKEVWVLIDVGTSECEIRKIASESSGALTFTPALSYAHAEGDPVIYSDRPIANVKYWGAKGDGSTNDYAAINGACAQASFVLGLTVYVPGSEASYRVSGTLPVYEGATIIGDGIGRTVIDFTHGTATQGFYANGSSGSIIDDITIGYMSLNGIAAQDNLIEFNYTNRSTIIEVRTVAAGNRGAYIHNSDNFTVERCIFQQSDGVGLQVSGVSGTHSFYGRVSGVRAVQNGSAGFTISNVDYVTISSCQSVSNTSQGFNITTSNHIAIIGNESEANGTYGIDLNGCNVVSISGNTTRNNTSGGMRVLGTTENVSYAGNSVYETTKIVHTATTLTDIANDDAWSHFIPAKEFEPYSGTPAIVIAGYGPVYAFNDGVGSGVTCWFASPNLLYHGSYTFYVYFASDSDAGGAIFKGTFGSRFVTVGQSINTAPTGVLVDYTVDAAGALALSIVRPAMTLTAVNGAGIVIRVYREGADAGETASGTMWFIGVRIQRANWQ